MQGTRTSWMENFTSASRAWIQW